MTILIAATRQDDGSYTGILYEGEREFGWLNGFSCYRDALKAAAIARRGWEETYAITHAPGYKAKGPVAGLIVRVDGEVCYQPEAYTREMALADRQYIEDQGDGLVT